MSPPALRRLEPHGRDLASGFLHLLFRIVRLGEHGHAILVFLGQQGGGPEEHADTEL